MEKQLFINNGKKIVDILNKLNIIPSQKLKSISEDTFDGEGICITFKLNDNTYSRGCYYYNKKKKLKGVGRGVYSNIGNYTGTFLFHLQILLAILSKSSKFSLENFTNDPPRAATGIYSLLNVKKMKDYNYLNNESLKTQLNISEGQMEIILTRDSYDIWKQSFLKLFVINDTNKYEKTEKEKKSKIQKFWGKNIDSKIKKFITNIENNYLMNNASKKTYSFESSKSRSSKSRSSKNYFLRSRTNKKRHRVINSTSSSKRTRKQNKF